MRCGRRKKNKNKTSRPGTVNDNTNNETEQSGTERVQVTFPCSAVRATPLSSMNNEKHRNHLRGSRAPLPPPPLPN